MIPLFRRHVLWHFLAFSAYWQDQGNVSEWFNGGRSGLQYTLIKRQRSGLLRTGRILVPIEFDATTLIPLCSRLNAARYRLAGPRCLRDLRPGRFCGTPWLRSWSSGAIPVPLSSRMEDPAWPGSECGGTHCGKTRVSALGEVQPHCCENALERRRSAAPHRVRDRSDHPVTTIDHRNLAGRNDPRRVRATAKRTFDRFVIVLPRTRNLGQPVCRVVDQVEHDHSRWMGEGAKLPVELLPPRKPLLWYARENIRRSLRQVGCHSLRVLWCR